jgi:hypothetical protein
MNWKLEKIRLLAESSLKDLTSGERDKMVKGMKDVPVARMIDAVNFLDKNILPAIKKKSGDQSADYKFFTEVIDYLIWAIVLVDRYETLEQRWIGQKLEIHLLRDHLKILEKELSKYIALEDLMLTSSLDLYAERVKAAALDRLKKETKIP